MSSGTQLPRVTRARYLNISKELKLQGSSFFTFRPPPRCLGSWKEIHLYPSPASRSARDPEAVCTGSLLRSCKTSGAQGCGGAGHHHRDKWLCHGGGGIEQLPQGTAPVLARGSQPQKHHAAARLGSACTICPKAAPCKPPSAPNSSGGHRLRV